MCVICLFPLLGDPGSEPWTAPFGHNFHQYYLGHQAEVTPCTVPELSCPVCQLSFQHVVDVELSSEVLATALSTQLYPNSPAAALPATAPVEDPLEDSGDLFAENSHPVFDPSEQVARRSRKRPPPVRTLPPLARQPLVMEHSLPPLARQPLVMEHPLTPAMLMAARQVGRPMDPPPRI